MIQKAGFDLGTKHIEWVKVNLDHEILFTLMEGQDIWVYKINNPRSRGLMSAERLELSTNGLKGHCSTIELRARARCILSCRAVGVNGP